MDKRTEIIEHHGVKVLFTDYLDLKKSEDIIAVIDEAEAIINAMPAGILYLINIQGAIGSPEVIKRYMPFAKQIQPKIAKDAVIGMTGLQRILVNGIKKFSGVSMVPFDTKEEALDFLIKK